MVRSRSPFFVILLIFSGILPVHAQDGWMEPAGPRTRYGGAIGLHLAAHQTDFRTLPGVPGCCTGYEGGTRASWYLGGTVEWPLGVGWNLHLLAGFADNGMELSKEDDIGPVETSDGFVDARVRHRIDATLSTLFLRPTVGFRVWDRLPVLFFTGLEAGYHLTRDYEQEERLIAPRDRTFTDGSLIRNRFSGEIPKSRTLFAGFTTGFRGDLPLSSTIRFQPEISATLSLLSLIPDPWMLNSLRAGIGLSYEPPLPPPPPPPTIPTLTVDLRVMKDSLVLGPHVPLVLVTTRTVRSDLHPLLPYIFFGQNSDALSSTGQDLLTAEGTSDFVETRLPNHTLAMYRSLLNILGSRMRALPTARITLTGCNNGGMEEKNNTRLSRRRAEVIKRYLVDVWGIDEGRISVVARNLPQETPDVAKSDGQQEARRVEISSDEMHLLQPIRKEETESRSELPSLRLYPTVYSDAGVDRWEWSVERNGHRLQSEAGTGLPRSILAWNPTTTDLAPDSTLGFTVSVRDQIGQQSTARVDVPVRHVERAFNSITREGNKRIDRFSLILFEFNSSTLRPAHQGILDLVRAVITPRSQVTIIGYADRTGAAEYNRELARARCEAVRSALFPSGTPEGLTLIPRGSDVLLYDNETPEGRNFCRTVQIIVETGLE